MIKLDISTALFLYLFFTTIMVFGLWIWLDRGYKASPFKLERKNIWQCSICNYIFINSKDESFSRCPRCSSINKKGGA